MAAVGEDIVAFDEGTGPVLTLLHGVGSDSRVWDRLTPLLTPHYRVLTVDLPGVSLLRLSDDSPSITALAQQVDQAMSDRGISEYSIIGHSFGGSVALVCAYAFPARVLSLLLIAPGGFGPETNPFLRLMGSRTGTAALRLAHSRPVKQRIYRAADRYRRRAQGPSSIEEIMQTYERLATRESRTRFRRSVNNAFETRRRVGTNALAVPELPIKVVWGENDLVLPVWQADRVKAMFPWSSVQVVPGAGHTPQRSHPEVLAEAIGQFHPEAADE